MEKHLEHEGTVASICGNKMIVRIVSSSACGGCSAKSYCIPTGTGDKDIHIENFSGNFISGERVKVVLRESLGFIALLIGYIIPFFVVIITLFTVYIISKNELVSGLLALLVLIPYFLIIKMLNPRITKTFGFTVQKINIT